VTNVLSGGDYDAAATDAVRLASFCFGVAGIVLAVGGMETASSAVAAAADEDEEEKKVEVLKRCLGDIAGLVAALVIVVGQSSFWILTVKRFGMMWILYPALLVVVNDSMAYVFGCLFGKTKLLPKLSPSKTWEGFLGASLSTLAVAVPLLFRLLKAGDDGTAAAVVWKHSLALATYVSLVAPFGGFLASAVKRAYGAKDFGSLIPGHGGVLDRLDCHVFSAPFVYLYLKKFLKAAVVASAAVGGDDAGVVAESVVESVAEAVVDAVADVDVV